MYRKVMVRVMLKEFSQVGLEVGKSGVVDI